MYTGIIQEIGSIISIERLNFGKRISIQCSIDFIKNIIIGASVSINGTCFTVVDFNKSIIDINEAENAKSVYFTVEATQATLDITNINEVEVNSFVNLERSSKLGDENGGHQIAGHVSGKVKIIEVKNSPYGLLRIEIPKPFIKYIFDKGFIAINGVSLTVSHIDIVTSIVKINLIPQTLQMTNFLKYKEGDYLNIEIDQSTKTMVDTLYNISKN